MKIKTFIISVLSILFAGTLVYANNPSADLTINNLKDALIGETTASAKYLAYSKKAKEEGYSKPMNYVI